MKEKIEWIREMLPLGELFILEAIRYYSTDVIESDNLNVPEGKVPIISPEMWMENAKKAIDKYHE